MSSSGAPSDPRLSDPAGNPRDDPQTQIAPDPEEPLQEAEDGEDGEDGGEE